MHPTANSAAFIRKTCRSLHLVAAGDAGRYVSSNSMRLRCKMKRTRFILLFSLISFIAGFGLSSIRHSWLSHAQTSKVHPSVSSSPSPTSPTNQTENAEDEFPRLTDDKYITKFNGTKLKLEYDSWGMEGDVPYMIDEAKLTPSRDGGLLVHIGNTLYKLDGNYQIVWKHRQTQIIFDYALVEATNLIYGTAGDNVMFILNATDGKKVYSNSRNGSAAYGVVQNYGNDMCLVTDNFAIYREKGRGANIEPMKDGVTCWRGAEGLWSQDFPPDAQLIVNGNRILAVTKTKTGIYVNDIGVPRKSK
jgi:hypothetical protein